MDSDLMMVAFGYHGAKFHGSQIQPDVRTVQGEIKGAIEKLGWWSVSMGVRFDLVLASVSTSFRTQFDVCFDLDLTSVSNSISHPF